MPDRISVDGADARTGVYWLWEQLGHALFIGKRGRSSKAKVGRNAAFRLQECATWLTRIRSFCSLKAALQGLAHEAGHLWFLGRARAGYIQDLNLMLGEEVS